MDENSSIVFRLVVDTLRGTMIFDIESYLRYDMCESDTRCEE